MSFNGLAENILLLEKITKVPENPHDNLIPAQLHQCQPTRVLRLEHEQSIVSALSFLSSYTDNSNNVSALCIEETSGRNGFLINVACNSGGVEELKAGLEAMATVLMDEATDARCENNAGKLLNEIVAFNRFRLLCRLRSTHSSVKARAKQPIVNSLAEALKKLRVLNTIPAEALQGLELIIQDMMTQFRAVERMDKTQARSEKADKFFLSILRSSDQLNTDYQLGDILGTIPQHEASFPDNRKTSLVEGIRKLSRYITLGPYLLRLARRLPVFQNIIVRCITIQPTVPSGLHNGAAMRMPQGLLHQYLQHRSSARKKTIKRFECRLGANLADIQADLRKKSICSKRIHAEIQLLFYYEQQTQTPLRPRVICASKNACYLCNAFLSLHNQFHTPKTHGKLYPQWTLPNLSALSLPRKRLKELENLYRQFHICIEQRILSCLETVSLVQSYDNESRILNIHSLTASEVSAVDHPAEEPGPNDARSLSRNSTYNSISSMNPSHNHSDNEGSLKASSIASISHTKKNIYGPASHHTVCSSSTTQNSAADFIPTSENVQTFPVLPCPALATPLTPKNLVPGHPVWSFISTLSPLTRFHTSRIHIELSYDDASSIASVTSLEQRDSNISSTKRGVNVRAVWLTPDEAEMLRGVSGEVDLTADWAWKRLDGILFDPNGLILRKGRDVLKLSAEGPIALE